MSYYSYLNSNLNASYGRDALFIANFYMHSFILRNIIRFLLNSTISYLVDCTKLGSQRLDLFRNFLRENSVRVLIFCKTFPNDVFAANSSDRRFDNKTKVEPFFQKFFREVHAL